MSVYGYSRVSLQKQADDGNGLDVQRRQVEGYAQMHGLKLDELFIEEGVSGSVPIADRPAGARLFARLKKGDIIIAPKLDRLFRSALDTLHVLEDLKKGGVSLHLPDLGGDISGNGFAKAFMTIAGLFAEMERERIGERMRDVKAHMAAEGRYDGGIVPFGYDAIDGKLVPNPDHDKLKVMGTMRDAGQTLRSIGAAVGLPHKTVARILARTA